MNVLLTGGAGYVARHTAVELLGEGHEVILFDDLSNASTRTIEAVRERAGRDVTFFRGDVRDGASLDSIFRARPIDAVLHVAGLKAVGESATNPLSYYNTNVGGTVRLLETMVTHRVKTMVFSSSATVYGAAGGAAPIREDAPTQPVNAYGRSKRMAEEILVDLHEADPEWRISILRYFNAAGSDPSGSLDEAQVGARANLLPALAGVAVGNRAWLEVFGGDYPTRDGTAVRDYLHVVDLARAHAQALGLLATRAGVWVHNLGTGRGYSVLEVVRTFESVSGVAIPTRIVGRRLGDVPVYCADPTRASRELGWRAQRDLAAICTDVWLAVSEKRKGGR